MLCDDALRHGPGGVHRILRRNAIEDDAEFVAAEPGDRIVGPGEVAKAGRDLTQNFVAGGVAVNVVDRLEAVEIDDENGGAN